MIIGDGKVPQEVTLRYQVPMLTWLRLRYYARREGLGMREACEKVLRAGFNAFGVPDDVQVLVGEEEGNDA